MQINKHVILNLNKPNHSGKKVEVPFKSCIMAGAVPIINEEYEKQKKQGLITFRGEMIKGIFATIAVLLATVEAYFLIFRKK